MTTTDPASTHTSSTDTRTGPRMANPGMVLPGAMDAILALNAAIRQGPVAATTLGLIHLRASQINGCASCLEAGTRSARKAGVTDGQLAAIADWRDATVFTPAERAALALAESVTRLPDSTDRVPDAIWDEATRHYDEPGLATLVLSIAVTNVFNRLNVTTRQVPGAW